VEYIDTDEFFAALYIRSGKTMWKSYRENVINLIKFTPIAGYVAVYDMTRIVEYFRQNTYEFIMPLTVMAIAYMLIIALVSWIMRDENRPKAKKQVDESAWAVRDD
jgi:ABC-type arginine/histidine transport system permease subunit